MAEPTDQIDAVLSGVKRAWAYVLGPCSAMLVGTALGMFAAGGLSVFAEPVGMLPTLAVVFVPMRMFGSNVGQLLAFASAGGVLCFWGSVAWRFDAWVVICIAFGVEAFRMFCGVPDGWQAGRVAGVCAAAGLVYSIIRYVPIYRYRKATQEAKAGRRRVRWRPFKRKE